MIAMLVLGVGLVLLISAYEYDPPTRQPYRISEDVLNVLKFNRIADINNNYAGPNSNLTRNGSITDISKTLIEQIGEFYYLNQMALIDKFLLNITQGLIPAEYNYAIIIENTTVYNHTSLHPKSSRFLIPTRTVIHGMHDNTILWGPYLVEVISWG